MPGQQEGRFHKERFALVDTPKNRRLAEQGQEDDRLVALRTAGTYWGQERTVVVTYNPLTATKQRYAFDRKILKLQAVLYEFRGKVRDGSTSWRKQEKVAARYKTACDELHLPGELYDVNLEQRNGQLTMSFRKNYYPIGRHIDRFGKKIIITDHDEWNACASSTPAYAGLSAQRKPLRILEEPTTDQALILKAFGHEVKSEVLQKLSV